MPIRDFQKEDRAIVLEMVDVFYHSSAVDHDIPVEHFANAFNDMCCGGSPYLRGLLMECNGKAAGFCLLAFTYSTEAGGPVVLIEELFVRPEFRGKGMGQEVLDYIKKEYHKKAARLRLEVAPCNVRAAALYKKLGFEILPYTQMINENF